MNNTMELAAAVAAEYYAEDAELVIRDLWQWKGGKMVYHPEQITLPTFLAIPIKMSLKVSGWGETVEFDLKLHAATDDTCVYNVCRSGGWPEVTA